MPSGISFNISDPNAEVDNDAEYEFGVEAVNSEEEIPPLIETKKTIAGTLHYNQINVATYE